MKPDPGKRTLQDAALEAGISAQLRLLDKVLGTTSPPATGAADEDAEVDLLHLLTFRAGPLNLAVEVAWVREIIRPARIEHALSSTVPLCGVMHEPAGPNPIVDLAALLGTGATTRPDGWRVVTFEIDERTYAFAVDTVGELIRWPAIDLQPAPTAERPHTCLTARVAVEDPPAWLLDPSRLLSPDQREALARIAG